MFYPIALFAILFFDFIVIILKIKYASVSNHTTLKAVRPERIYPDILTHASDTQFTGMLRQMKVIKMFHHQQHA